MNYRNKVGQFSASLKTKIVRFYRTILQLIGALALAIMAWTVFVHNIGWLELPQKAEAQGEEMTIDSCKTFLEAEDTRLETEKKKLREIKATFQ